MGFLFLLVAWLALVAGLSEAAYRLFHKVVLGNVVLVPFEVVWTTPLVDFVWLGIPAVFLFAAHRLLPSKVTVPAVAGALTALAVFPLLLLATTMHKAVVVLLMTGIGVQTFRIVARHRLGYERLIRRSFLPLLALALTSSVTIAVLQRLQERRAIAALPDASPDVPNILLVIWDTVRGGSMSLYGYSRPTTPFLETFARDGARFDLALATAPWTLPSHASMFTGRRPTTMSSRLNTPLDATHPVIAEEFSRAGYATGGFIANMSYCARDHGLARGFIHYEDYRLTVGGMISTSRLGHVLLRSRLVRDVVGFYDLAGRKSAAQVNHGLLPWIDRQAGRPFFAFLNYFDAHQPYIAPEPFRSRFTLDADAPFKPRTVDVKFHQVSEEEIVWSQGEYDAGIAYQDSVLADLVAELDRRGLLENTMIVITSDHGEHFGDHGRISHGNSLYRQLLQVPLVIRFPGKVPRGVIVSAPVSLADLPQTLLGLAGVKPQAEFPGASLERFWTIPETAADEVVLSEMPTEPAGGSAHSLVTQGYHYIRWFGRPPELYHLQNDPGESTDLAADSANAPLLARFAALEQELGLNSTTRQSRNRRPQP